jgi:hypothetical protein
MQHQELQAMLVSTSNACVCFCLCFLSIELRPFSLSLDISRYGLMQGSVNAANPQPLFPPLHPQNNERDNPPTTLETWLEKPQKCKSSYPSTC